MGVMSAGVMVNNHAKYGLFITVIQGVRLIKKISLNQSMHQ